MEDQSAQPATGVAARAGAHLEVATHDIPLVATHELPKDRDLSDGPREGRAEWPDGGGGGCGPTVEGFAAMPYMPYLCRICAVSVPYLPIIQLIWIVGTAWSIETIPIIRMPHMP